MARIFISYSREDEDFACRLAADLGTLGAEIWIDVQDIPAGEKWSTAIQEGLKKCDVLIVVISPASMSSTNVEDEWQYFLDQKKPVIPVLYQPAEVHFQLNRLQYIDFHTQDSQAALSQLRAELQRKGIQGAAPSAADAAVQIPPQPRLPTRKTGARVSRNYLYAGIALIIVAVIAVVALVIASSGDDNAGDDESIPPVTWLRSGEDPRLEVLDGKGAQRVHEGDYLNVANPDTVLDGDTLISQNSTLRVVFQAQAFAIVRRVAIVEFVTITDTGRSLRLSVLDGEVFVERGEWADIVALAIGPAADVEVTPIASSLSANYNQAEQTLRVACYTGECRATNLAAADDVIDLTAGQATTLDLVTRDFKNAVIEPIPQSEYDQYTRLCGGDCGFGTAANVPAGGTTGVTVTATSAAISRNADWTPVVQDVGGVEMVQVPAGCFMMGSDGRFDNESPAHEVCFEEAFWIDRTEVSNAQFDAFGGAAAILSSLDEPELPRDMIIWAEARDFCESRGARLPTEAEWEYAARGPDGLLYPWGNVFDGDNLVYDANSGGVTAAVGSTPGDVSWVGALDMTGNVTEWIADWYDDTYYGTLADGVVNPQGPSTGNTRVLRGGAWISSGADNLHASVRGFASSDGAFTDVGFRCARSQDAVAEAATENAAAEPTPTRSSTPDAATSTDGGTATPKPPPEPDIRLSYTEDELLLTNVSDSTLDISNLVFEQFLGDGTTRSFEVTSLSSSVLSDSSQMPTGSCFYVTTVSATPGEPDVDECPSLLGFHRIAATSSLFWLSDNPSAMFAVRDADSDTMLAACYIRLGECEFALAAAPALMTTPTSAPLSITPTLTALCFVSADISTNVRAQPGPTATTVGTLEADDTAVVTEQQIGTDDQLWYLIESPLTGWVREDTVQQLTTCPPLDG